MAKKKFAVNLPKTSFPMKADLPNREPGFLSLWKKAAIYKKGLERNSPDKTFLLHDGPPYANGHLHMGHALNKILKDIIVKYKAAQGFHAPYIPGWDCHGLPIEHQLMKEKNWTKHKIGRVPFRQEAARYAEKFVDIQRDEFKRLGIQGDWDHPYLTLSPDYEAGIARTFYDLLNKGFIYRDKKPVYWCASCETALAEAEVEYAEKTSPSIFVKFPIQEWPGNVEAQAMHEALGPGKKISVLVWTTTPWTLPANVALAFHPEGKYRVWTDPKTKERYLVGEPGWKFLEELSGETQEAAETIDGMYLEGLLAQNPLNNNDSQGVLADFVSQEEGTGVVHIAPGHGQEDYGVGREYGLPVISPVDEAGRFVEDVRPTQLAGQRVWDANAVINDALRKSQHLLKEKKITHSYPHCWRCKHPILFRATEQWFLRVDDAFRQKLIESVPTVNWTPAYGQERILGMLKSRPDWCLARQRYWGAPIPMFLCTGCKTPLQDDKVFDRIVALFKEKGSTVWFEKEAQDLLPQGTQCGKCKGSDFKKEEDILDVWFDSGVSWVSVLRQRLGVKNRDNVMYLEGSDQHRGWFQTSLLPAVALTDAPPYKEVLTHGFVVDGEGRKMSKSLGNVISPQEILKKYGADILRLWVAMSDYSEDIRLSQDIVDRVVDTYRKIRNTLRFLLGNLSDFDPKEHAVNFDDMTAIDQGILSELNDLVRSVQKSYDRYEFHLVSHNICNDFCINTLSGYYLDVQKDILYCDQPSSPRRRSAQTAFWRISQTLAQLLAPILSFTAEETWQVLGEQNLLRSEHNKDSLFLNPFAPVANDVDEDAALKRFKEMQNLRALFSPDLEKIRQSGQVKGLNDTHLTLTLSAQSLLAGVEAKHLSAYLGVAKTSLAEGQSNNGTEFQLEKAPGDKCERCWVWREDLNEQKICGRCAQAEEQNAQQAPAQA